MSVIDTKHTIKAALESFRSGNLSHNAINLFKALGYSTERQAPFEKQNYDSFKSSFVEGNSRFNEEKAMVAEWKYVDLLFQISHEEITKQYSAFKKEVVTREDGSKIAIESFLFFAIELKSEAYSRSALSHITREVNKLFPMPAIVLFKQGLLLTLAVINRRLHKRDESKDVLEKVTFIKDINIETPHRAHIEILFDLSFEQLLGVYKFTNFVELHSAWQKTLDTKELNKKFYKELSNWYFWAMGEVYFPGAALHADKNSLFKKEDKEKEHNATNLIRLLTRLLFVWFVKEKGLIPEEFFDEKYVADELLVNFKSKKDRSGSLSTVSCYYRAILQNLFFATLNQDMGKREFRKPGQHMNVTNLLRYERYLKDTNKYIKLIEKTTPFMNGGLFECLDIPDPEKRGRQGGDVIIYQDGFSDRDDNQLKVPDYIFFGAEDHVDLSEAYGDNTKEYKNATVKGLINILKSYKFTVAENTPLEEEVALDPELLGRVFENLLASYNPETKTTARKQTGSFYTPREIVNYMVDESLIAYLQQKLEDAGVQDKEESLRDLVSYSENPNPFNKKETTLLINAIDSSKILDPACGSGAFPMGILHKLVHILHKLDPRNELWEQRQIEKAQSQDDPVIREQLIADIGAAFENNELDYGRKLYLIENCIYGVDIQPIATQISKLRFFISLIVDQKVDTKKENFGVRPLPNLETKFVAANTLIEIEKPEAQMSFGSVEVKALEAKLKDIRHRLFSAKTPTTKRKLREEDKLIREQMGKVLVKSGWKNEVARQLANWDPYDQNASSSFFDPEWMFGITNGFDVVMGNPPYVSAVSMARTADVKQYFKVKYPEATGSYDIFVLFLLRTLDLTNPKGHYSWIIPNKFLIADYARNTKNKLLKNGLSVSIDVSVFEVFENTNVYPIIILGHKGNADNNIFKECLLGAYSDLSKRCFENPKTLKEHKTFSDFNIKFGSGATGFEAEKLKKFISNNKKDKSMQFVVSGGIDKFCFSNKNIRYMGLKLEDAYIEYTPEIAQSKWHFWSNAKVVIAGMTKEIEAVFVNKPLALGVGVYAIYYWGQFNPKYLTGLLNSKYVTFYMTTKFKDKHLAGGYLAINKSTLENLPLVFSNKQEIVALIVDYMQLIKTTTSNKDFVLVLAFFQCLIDAIAYELYLSEEIKSSGCDVLRQLTNLAELKDDWSNEKKLAVIEEIYNKLSDPKHPVSVSMSKMQEIGEVRIIEGKA